MSTDPAGQGSSPPGCTLPMPGPGAALSWFPCIPEWPALERHSYTPALSSVHLFDHLRELWEALRLPDFLKGEDQEEGSVNIVLTTQAWGPEFGFPAPRKKPGIVVHAERELQKVTGQAAWMNWWTQGSVRDQDSKHKVERD